MEDQIEARERRRAKILASKEERMSRITGVHKSNESSTSPPIKIDEVLVQEYMAESKKHAVELAKEDYSMTHKEHENEPDEPLSPEEIKMKREKMMKSPLVNNPQNDTKFDLIMGSVVVIVAATSGAFFFWKRSVEASLAFCLNFDGLSVEENVETCRQGLLPLALQTTPTTLAVSLLPVLSDWFKGKRSLFHVFLAIFSKILLFKVIFLVVLRILQQ